MVVRIADLGRRINFTSLQFQLQSLLTISIIQRLIHTRDALTPTNLRIIEMISSQRLLLNLILEAGLRLVSKSQRGSSKLHNPLLIPCAINRP